MTDFPDLNMQPARVGGGGWGREVFWSRDVGREVNLAPTGGGVDGSGRDVFWSRGKPRSYGGGVDGSGREVLVAR
jgi:hypothetical protein